MAESLRLPDTSTKTLATPISSEPRWWLKRPRGVQAMSDAHLLAVLQILRREALRRGLRVGANKNFENGFLETL